MKTLKYSEMLKEVLRLYPREIPCDDAEPIGDEGMGWMSLHTLEEQLDEKHNYFEDTNALISVLLWSVLVGIVEGFRKEYVKDAKLKKDKPCKTLSPVEVIDLEKTLEHFEDSVENTEYWQNYLKERNETVLYDEVTRDELRKGLEQADRSDDFSEQSSDILPEDFMK